MPSDSSNSTEYYLGIFGRIMETYDIDFYWMWTPEDWEVNESINRYLIENSGITSIPPVLKLHK
jgi:hypothetical protein